MASSNKTSNLPVEVAIEIFHSFGKIADAAHLARTSRFFYSIWQFDLSAICRTVLRRTFDYYDEANELATAIIEHKKNELNLHGNPAQAQFLENGINKEKLIAFLSRIVTKQFDKFAAESYSFTGGRNPNLVGGIRRPGGGRSGPPPFTDRDAFLLLYYRLWILAVIPSSSAQEYIEAHNESDRLKMAKFVHQRMLATRLSGSEIDMTRRIYRDWDRVLRQIYWKLAEYYADAVGSHKQSSWHDRVKVLRFPYHENFKSDIDLPIDRMPGD